MNYLITGTNGFVGKTLTYSLLKDGHNIYGIDCEEGSIRDFSNFYHFEADITNPGDLEEIFKQINIDGVFHLAAQSSVAKSWSDSAFTYKINTLGTSILIESLKKVYYKSLPRLLFFSSSEIYGNITKSEINEDEIPKPINPYGFSKFFAETIIQNFYENYLIVRPFSIIGKGQQDFFAVPNFCKQVALILKNKHPSIINVGNIKIRRNFVDIDDSVRAVKIIMQKSPLKEIYNLASSESVLLEDILELLKGISGINFEVKIDDNRLRPIEMHNMNASIKKLNNLGWSPSVTLKESLTSILQSYL